MSARAHLHVVRVNTETGEVEELKCDGCRKRETEIEGLNSVIRSQGYKLRKLQEDHEMDAYLHPFFLRLAEGFWYWRELTGHTKCEYTVDRFDMALPFAKNKKYKTYIPAAIRGIAFDPFVASKPNRSGRLERYDSWETLFKNTGSFERYVNRDPGREWAQERMAERNHVR